MDMHKILKNFDDASTGKKPGAATANANEMKAILESFDRVATVEECGMMPDSMPAAMPQKEGSPVSMNISLNASGKENVDELMALLKGAGIGQPTPVKPMPGGAAFDLDTDGANDMEIELPSKGQEMDMATMRQIIATGDKDVDEEWDNSPEERYSDHETMTQDLSGGINRQKKQFKPSAKGDNPMAVESIKDRLWAALSEKKTTEGKYKSDAQRKAIHANKDKKK